MKPTAALCNILFDLIAHAALPELAEMVGNAGDSLLMRISCEKEGDLIRTVNHTFRGHVRGYFAELDSPSICVVLLVDFRVGSDVIPDIVNSDTATNSAIDESFYATDKALFGPLVPN